MDSDPKSQPQRVTIGFLVPPANEDNLTTTSPSTTTNTSVGASKGKVALVRPPTSRHNNKSQIPGWSDDTPTTQILSTSCPASATLSNSSFITPAVPMPLSTSPRKHGPPSKKQPAAPLAATDAVKVDKKAAKKAKRAAVVASRGPIPAGGVPSASNTTSSAAAAGAMTSPLTESPTTPTTTLVSSTTTPVAAQGTAREKRVSLTSASVNRPQARQQATKDVALFRHLAHDAGRSVDVLRREMEVKGQALHPTLKRLGLAYQHFKIVGSNERCLALVQAFRQVIQDYTTPINSTLCRHLDAYLKPQINYLVACRPMSVSMGNLIRYLKWEIASVPPDFPEDEAKRLLDEKLVTYVRERIICADAAIVEYGLQKIKPHDVILTFGYSSVVQNLLVTAHTQNIPFRVIVVDARPLNEGRRMIAALTAAGLDCTYTPLSGLSYVMKETSKVLLGAHALLSNGTLMARVGSAMVSMMAHEMGVPLIVCCETYKFSDRVQLDSFVYNELGDADRLVEREGRQPLVESVLPLNSQREAEQPASVASASLGSMGSSGDIYRRRESTTRLDCREETRPLAAWREIPDLKLLNLMYDVTPSAFVTLVITEIGMIPSSSVPVVIRLWNQQQHQQQRSRADA